MMSKENPVWLWCRANAQAGTNERSNEEFACDPHSPKSDSQRVVAAALLVPIDYHGEVCMYIYIRFTLYGSSAS